MYKFYSIPTLTQLLPAMIMITATHDYTKLTYIFGYLQLLPPTTAVTSLGLGQQDIIFVAAVSSSTKFPSRIAMRGVLISVIHASTILVNIRISCADFECLTVFEALEGETRASITLFVVFFAMWIIVNPFLDTSRRLVPIKQAGLHDLPLTEIQHQHWQVQQRHQWVCPPLQIHPYWLTGAAQNFTIKATTSGNRGVFLWNDWKASTFDPWNPYSTFLSRVLTLVIVKVEDQLKFYKSRIGRAKSATALACQMLSICVRAFMTYQNDPEKGRNHGPTSILQEDICHCLI